MPFPDSTKISPIPMWCDLFKMRVHVYQITKLGRFHISNCIFIFETRKGVSKSTFYAYARSPKILVKNEHFPQKWYTRENQRNTYIVNPDSLFHSCYVSNCFHSAACLVFCFFLILSWQIAWCILYNKDYPCLVKLTY